MSVESPVDFGANAPQLDFFESPSTIDVCHSLLSDMRESYMERIVMSLRQMLGSRAAQYRELRRSAKALVTVGDKFRPATKSGAGSVGGEHSASDDESGSEADNADDNADDAAGDADAEKAVSDDEAKASCSMLLAAGAESAAHALAALMWNAMADVRCCELLEVYSDAPDGVPAMQQLLRDAWSDAKTAKRAPASLHAMLDLHFGIGRWVRGAVLSRDSVDERSKMLAFFVDVARHAAALNNFAVLDALVAALCGETVSADALPCSWAGVPADDVAQLAQLAAKVSTGGKDGATSYHEALRAAQAPGVPLVRVTVQEFGDAMGAALLETAASLGTHDEASSIVNESDNDAGEAAARTSGSAVPDVESPSRLMRKARRRRHMVPKSLASLLPGATVAPPARTEQHSVVHVHAWKRCADCATDLSQWQQTTYDVAAFAPHRDAALPALRRALCGFGDDAALQARSDALRDAERQQQVSSTPAERELHAVIADMLGNDAAAKALATAVSKSQNKLLDKHRDGLKSLEVKAAEKHEKELEVSEKRLLAARARLASSRAAWSEPNAPLELVGAACPDADVALESLDDADGVVLGWPHKHEVTVVRARAAAGAAAPAADTEAPAENDDDTAADSSKPDGAGAAPLPPLMVALCPRVAGVAHICAAKRAAQLYGSNAAPLIVTSQCASTNIAMAKAQGVRGIVV